MKVLGAIEKKLQLLKDVVGAFRPDILTALMGLSGAGNTTLMDVLSGRKTRGYIKPGYTHLWLSKGTETFS